MAYVISMNSEHLDFSSIVTSMQSIEIRMHKTNYIPKDCPHPEVHLS